MSYQDFLNHLIKIIVKSLIVFLTTVILFSSCFKQKTSEVPNGNQLDIQNIERIESCSNTSLLQNIMLKESLEHLFLCTQWNKTFPHLFETIQNIDQNQWNYVFSKVNRRIFNDKNKLRRLINLTRKLDEKDSLHGLTESLTSLIDMDPYNLLSLLFGCIKVNESSDCLSYKTLQDQPLKSFFLDFILEQNTITEIINIFDAIISSINPHRETLRADYLSFYRREDFVVNRVNFIDALIQGIASIEERSFLRPLRFVLKALEANQINTALDYQEKKDVLINLAAGLTHIDDNFFQTLLTYRNFLKKELPCHEGNKNLYFSPEKHLDTLFSEILSSDLQRFYNLFIQEIILEDFLVGICPLVYDNEAFTKLSLSRIKEYIFPLFNNDYSFDLVKSVIASLKSSNNSNIALLDLLSSPLLRSTFNIFKSVIHNNQDFLSSLIDVMTSLDRGSYISLSNLFSNLLSREHIHQFQRLEALWNVFSFEEKNRIFSYIDSFFEKDINFVLLFKYFNEVLKILKNDIVFLVKEMSSEEAFESFKSIVKKFNSNNVRNDLRSFYSRDHIMRIIKILSDGLLDRSPEEVFTFDEKIMEKKQRTLPEIKSHSLIECAKYLSSNNHHFLNIETQELKSICPHLDNKKIDFFLNLISMAKTVHSLPSLGRYTIENSKIIDSKVNQQKGLWNNSQQNTDIFLKKNTVRTFIKGVLAAVTSLIEGDDGREYRKRLYQMFGHNATLRKRFKNIIETLPLILKDWKNFSIDEEYYQFRPMPPRYQCQNYNNMNIGGNPCPDVLDIPSIIKNGIEMVLDENGQDLSTLLYQYLLAFSVGHGIPINIKNSLSATYKLTINESFNFLDKTTDLSRLENKISTSYVDRHFQENVQETTILQRIETAIREGRFDDNYLIIHGVNSIVENSNYNNIVESSENTLRRCAFFRFCGKVMNRNESRMAHNLLAFFSGIKNINQKELEYGNFARAFLKIHVTSSPNRSQGVGAMSHFLRSQRDLRNHNINFLTYMASFSVFSNISRIIKDRAIKEEDIRFISGEFFKNITPRYLETTLSSILQATINVKNASGKNLIEYLTHTIGNLTYSERRTVENLLANTLTVLHYLGPLRKEQGIFFTENSLETFFSIGKILIYHWPSLVAESPKKNQILRYTKKLNNFLFFLKTKLHDTNSQKRYYSFINEAFYFIKKIIFIENRDLNLVKLYTKNVTVNTRKMYGIIGSLVDLSTDFDKNRFYESLIFTLTLLNEDKLQFDPYLSYLNLVSNEFYDHFDSPYRLLEFFTKNFDTLYDNLVENHKEISNVFRRILAAFFVRPSESLPSPIR